jgi:ParB family chromosome partitioning protein
MSTGAEKSRKPLGRGLSALLPTKTAAPPAAQAPPNTVSIDAIVPNPLQPRTIFQPERLEELAASIRVNGIIQPLIVRRTGQNFQIVAGERRWRAARIAGLTEVPIVIQEVADRQMLELALIENLQREDLNPIETAHAYERLGKELGISQEEIGRRTGKDRASITNMIRLLRLPNEVQLLIAEHRISTGHAKAILGLGSADEQTQLAEKTAAQGLSVRQVEKLVQEATSEPAVSGHRKETPQDPNVRAAVGELERALGTRVRIVELSEQRGRIEIDYFSQPELDRLYQFMVGNK